MNALFFCACSTETETAKILIDICFLRSRHKGQAIASQRSLTTVLPLIAACFQGHGQSKRGVLGRDGLGRPVPVDPG